MKLLFWLLVGFGVWFFWKRSTPSAKAMSRDEAANILGLSRDADVETVLAAHRRLIARVHPDTGGSAELAAQINRARDILIGQIAR
jgi:DnaJ homolog subfamily C member 19